MRTVEHPDFTEQHDADPRPFSFQYLCAQCHEESLDVGPANGPAHGMREYLRQRNAMTLLQWY